MKEIFRPEDTLSNKISYFHILAFMLCLPFDRFYSELILISFLLHELIHFKKDKIRGFRVPVILPAILYILTIAGAFYTSEKEQMFKDLEKQLGLLLFPLIFSLTSLDLKKYRAALLKAFALFVLVIVLYLFFDACRIIIYNKLPMSALITPSFLNHNFSLPLNLHATYLSMFVVLAAAVFLQLIISSRKLLHRLFYISAFLILMMAILQLSSKAVFIATLLITNIAIPFLIRSKSIRWKVMMASIVVTLVAIAGLTKSETFQSRYITAFKEDLTQSSYNINLVEPRMVRWRSALQVVKQSPVFGHGSGSESSLLKEKYFENKLFISYLHELNAHNEYISFLIKTGIVGLAVFLFVLGFGLKKAIDTRDFICCSFFIVVAIVSLSENILDVNKGIFFFSFFYSFFMKSEVENEKAIITTYNPSPAG